MTDSNRNIKNIVEFGDLELFGRWDNIGDSIPIKEITQITYGDNYSGTFFKYIEK